MPTKFQLQKQVECLEARNKRLCCQLQNCAGQAPQDFCADCTFTITGATGGPLAFSAGALTSTCGTVGDYLIEWRTGSATGLPAEYTGVGADPNINHQHPFTNVSIAPGTYYPVLIYVEVDTVMYSTTTETPNATLMAPVTCLSPVSITAAAGGPV